MKIILTEPIKNLTSLAEPTKNATQAFAAEPAKNAALAAAKAAVVSPHEEDEFEKAMNNASEVINPKISLYHTLNVSKPVDARN